jgi:hypothetical protein
MIRPFRILITLVLVSGILSCNKHKDSDSNSNANKFRLSKLIQWSSASPSKNIVTNEFVYDDQKRLVEIATFNGDSVNGEIKSAKFRSIKFFYNGTDKNPFKTIGAMSNLISIANAETFYSYNANGSLIRDSTPATSSYSGIVRNYIYSSDKIVIQSTNPSYAYDKSKDSFIVANHNLVAGFLYITPYSTQANGYKLTYDNKVNPISKLNIASLTTVTGPFGFPSFLAPGYCQNNITEYTYGYSTGPGNFSGQTTYYYTYSYNESNLPVECRIYNNNANTTIKYYYID